MSTLSENIVSLVPKTIKELNKLNTLFLKKVVVKENGLIKISPEFDIRDIEHVKELVNDIDVLVKSLPILSDTGYINESGFNIPMVDYVAQVFLGSKYKILIDKIDKIDKNTRKSYSITLNKVVHNLILLLLLYLINKIELWFSTSKNIKKDENLVDLIVDIKNIKRTITVMIHPYIKSKLGNRGMSVTLNGYSGYDSEYCVKDETQCLNKMLSGQIAGNTGIYLRVPVVNVIPLRYTDISRDDHPM